MRLSRHIIGIMVETGESKEAGTERSKGRQELSEMSALNHGEEYFLYHYSHRILCDAEVYLMSIQLCSVCRHCHRPLLCMWTLQRMIGNMKMKKSSKESKVLWVLDNVKNLGNVELERAGWETISRRSWVGRVYFGKNVHSSVCRGWVEKGEHGL